MDLPELPLLPALAYPALTGTPAATTEGEWVLEGDWILDLQYDVVLDRLWLHITAIAFIDCNSD